MITIELTDDEHGALVTAACLAIDEQREYLGEGHFPTDYGEEWSEVAERKAGEFNQLASVLRKLGNATRAAFMADDLAKEFRASATESE